MKLAYQEYATQLENEYALRNKTTLHPKRHQRGDGIATETTSIDNTISGEANESIARAMNWCSKVAIDMAGWVEAEQLTQTRMCYANHFAEEPGWIKEHPPGGSVRNTYRTIKDSASAMAQPLVTEYDELRAKRAAEYARELADHLNKRAESESARGKAQKDKGDT